MKLEIARLRSAECGKEIGIIIIYFSARATKFFDSALTIYDYFNRTVDS